MSTLLAGLSVGHLSFVENLRKTVSDRKRVRERKGLLIIVLSKGFQPKMYTASLYD